MYNIFLVALRTSRITGASKIKLNTALADPALDSGWIAIDQSIIGYVFGNHRASTYEGIPAYSVATNDGSISSDGRPFLDQGGHELVFLGYMAAGVRDIGKDTGRTAEDIVL